MRPLIRIVLLLTLINLPLTRLARGDNQDQQLGHTFLYTKPDPSASGGIEGTITVPASPIAQVLAIPADEPRFVYKAEVSGDHKRHFRFTGLPFRKYDLIVIYDDQFFEGLRLHRDPNTLTPQDRQKITDIITASEPFFKKKFIHRLEGSTGKGNEARAICTFLRDAESDAKGGGFRRTFKLVMLKDVGPGWQVVRTRDLYPLTVAPEAPLPRHHFSDTLSGIRVTGSIKSLGEIDLTR